MRWPFLLPYDVNKNLKNVKKSVAIESKSVILRVTKAQEGDMVKVTGLNELAEIIESNNRIEKAEREIKKARVKELIAQGIDPEIAKVMVNVGL